MGYPTPKPTLISTVSTQHLHAANPTNTLEYVSSYHAGYK